MGKYVGQSVIRIDGPERVTGKTIYAPDIQFSDMLYGAVARSSHAHALLKEIRTEKARRSPGVRAVITGDMLPYMFGSMIADQPFLAKDRVRYNGEPIALVIAESELEAQMAADAIEASYEDLPAVFDVFEALKDDAPLVHEDQHAYRRDPARYPALDHTNICNETSYELGDVEKAFAQADHVFEHCSAVWRVMMP